MKRRANKVLKVIRAWSGVSQQQMALALMADQSTVSRVERGEVDADERFIRRWVDVCGGLRSLKQIADEIYSVIDMFNSHRLLPV